jgi:hypothetical protein
MPLSRHPEEIFRSALALLVTRVRLADHHDDAVTADHLAVIADGLDAGVYLHEFFLFAVFTGQAGAWGVTSRPV